MAELRSDSSNQAGGGARQNKAIETLDSTVLRYLKQIFESHAGTDQKWTNDQVKAFIHKVQIVDPESPGAKQLEAQDGLDLNGFLRYMTSPESAVTTPWKQDDMSWPLASYFISSSHNTYLTGNQLSSESTTDAYTNVLLRGCRCVEIDVWDGDESDSDSSSDEEKDVVVKQPGRLSKIKTGLTDSVTNKLENTNIGKKIEEKLEKRSTVSHSKTNSTTEKPHLLHRASTVEPRVLHGYTLTKEVSFRDVCKAIGTSAFVASDLPLIVSLEVHCGPEQQAIMVEIMTETWKDYLAAELDADATQLPSPHDLRRKILVKVKYAPPNAKLEDNSGSGEDDRLAEDEGTTGAKPKKPSKIIQELSRLGVYTRAISFKTWTQPEAKMASHIFSLAEKKFLDHRQNQSTALFEHNRHYLLRAYPSGLRIGSSNLNPPPFWASGAQIVALNWQQTDEGMMLNEGMFDGTQGYVLKPSGYLPSLPNKTSSADISRKTLHLSITFLAAQNIPIPAEDRSDKGFHPYIKAELHVDGNPNHHHTIPHNGHEREGEYKIRTATHKSSNIDLKAQKLTFPTLDGLVDELSFLRFTIRDDELGKDDLAAWACVRLDRLGSGYRFIHLWDCKGRQSDGVVLIKVEKTLA